MRYETIRDIDFDGHDLRIWCHRCARGFVVDSVIWEAFLARGWSIEVTKAGERFRCTSCNRTDQILLVPATRSTPAPRDWASEVVGYFHATRARRKHRKAQARRTHPSGGPRG